MMFRALSAIVLSLAAALASVSPAYADSWGASWGRVDGVVQPLGQYDRLVWNTALPEDWLLYAAGEVFHNHPPLSHAYREDLEEWSPLGDGRVVMPGVQTGDLATVQWVEAAVYDPVRQRLPYVDINRPLDVLSAAHAIPNSWSAAAGIGQHDNLFWILYDGPGKPPPSTPVRLSLVGPWNLAGGGDFFADTFAYAEVYDQKGKILGFDWEYHSLGGLGSKSAARGEFHVQFTVDLEYDTSYAFRFWLDDESYAAAVPEPASAVLLLIGGLLVLGRRRT